jgi:hypothetical protein
VTYSTLRFLQSSPESQNTLRTDATQKPRKADGKGIHFKQLESPIFYALLNFSCTTKISYVHFCLSASNMKSQHGKVVEWKSFFF